MERRLAAIFAADVVGYSKLMTEDEETTLVQLKAHRAELFDPKIAEHNGRIVKLMGLRGSLLQTYRIEKSQIGLILKNWAMSNG